MEKYDPRVDAYIEKAADFAKPILLHVRQLVHGAAPQITETVKWGMPFFDYKGPVCQIASFKQHCAFGFWKATSLNDPQGLINPGEAAAGSFGKLTQMSDLPSDEVLVDFINQAIQLNESGVKGNMKTAAGTPKAEIPMPAYFAEALSNDSKALTTFENFSPSHKREYLEWITEAKTDATREKRVATALEWLSEGKSRHWKYK
ncbi:YdeI/OmpD-associated family protein [Mucilaginibacter sp. HD30]